MKTLIVEDDFVSRLLLQTILSPYGECHIAVNGREALDAFRLAGNGGRQYDLICLDIMLPEMDGHAVLKEIRILEEAEGIPFNRGVKIIMTTALHDPNTVVSAFHSLCNAYMVKPVDMVELLNHIESFGLI